MHGSELKSGALFGGVFRISHRIGAGGMAVVYAVEQIATGQPRALKLMQPALLAEDSLRARFEQEARVSALIPSDHVVQVIDAGVDAETEVPWIAMELLDGEDLEAYVARRGPLPAGEALEILRQVCHALGAAHQVGVIHRDLKPQNVFVVTPKTSADVPMVKVLDFGIAKMVAHAHRSTLTLGTPLWMSPEHSDPRAHLTAAADVWALGLVAFWLLTGRDFWLSAAREDIAMQAAMREILFDPIPLASSRAGELGCAASIPGGFDPWFERCLHRDAAARFADASEAFAALTLGLAGVKAETIAPPRSDQTHARVRKAFENSSPVAVVRSSAPIAKEKRSTSPLRASGNLQRIGLIALSTALVGSAVLSYALGLVQLGPRPPAAAPPAAPSGAAPAPATGIEAPTTSSGAAMQAPPPTASPTASASAVQAASAAAPVAKPQVAVAPRRFDESAAQAALRTASRSAKLICAGRDGPRSVTVQVVFAPAGTTQRILATDLTVAATPSYACMTALLHTARVRPFDGGESPPVVTTVSME